MKAIRENADLSIRVALVEDDAPARKILARWLEAAEGFQLVGQYGDAEQALSDLPRLAVDIVLADIQLPAADGIEMVRLLKPRMAKTQFVMLTVYEDSKHIFNALRAGATGYLLKRTTYEEFLAALKYVHAGGSPMNSYIARQVAQFFPTDASPQEATDLSPREWEVLKMMAQGYLYKEIADALNIGVRTVDTYVRRIYEKLHVRSRAQAVAKYVNWPSGP